MRIVHPHHKFKMSEYLLGVVDMFCGYLRYYPHLMASPCTFILEQMAQSNIIHANLDLLIPELENVQLDGPIKNRNLFIDYMVFREELLSTIQVYLSYQNRTFAGLIQHVTHYWNIVNLRVDRKFTQLLTPEIMDVHQKQRQQIVLKEKKEVIKNLLDQQSWTNKVDVQFTTCILLDELSGTTKWRNRLQEIHLGKQFIH